MSTRAFITGVSGTELTAAERAFGRAERSWDLNPFRSSFEISTQATVSARELAASDLIAPNRAGFSIPVDGAAEPAHPGPTSAKMVTQVIRSAVRFQDLLMSDDVSTRSALSGRIAERLRAMFAGGGDTMLHRNDIATLGPSIARANTASA
ncbi:hypothetical protein [Bradyrhizobium sp. BR13661]|jgi:hypothetical protein|uniref:hypothetical protein n=1 Tax=Bradyrhizobium sp. BR13661 TaxID=2940622 RepID=UPI002474AA5F|nr:hypothetical protein [Bradyrhizobium sp. BR13661]MDH6257691.1 hypothetical protein [Bradyrhizobium sp. BR13661]